MKLLKTIRDFWRGPPSPRSAPLAETTGLHFTPYDYDPEDYRQANDYLNALREEGMSGTKCFGSVCVGRVSVKLPQLEDIANAKKDPAAGLPRRR